MNDCKFFGKIVSRSITKKYDTSKIELEVSVQKQRKSKSGLTVLENAVLNFEAWDSAAETIEHNSTVGDFLVISSTAKIRENSKEVYFRINEFKIVSSNNLVDA
jgi:hypothetical protein